MGKYFTGFNRSEKVLILENQLLEFEHKFKEWNTSRFSIPEHVYRDFCHNRAAYLEAIQEVVQEATWWASSIDPLMRPNKK